MSTALQSEIEWGLTFVDGTSAGSGKTLWANLARGVQVDDGLVLPLTQKDVTSLVVKVRQQSLIIEPPDPCPFFAFRRLASGGEEVLWHYTLFGYLVPEYALTVRVTAHSMTHLLLRRPLSLSLL